MPHQLEVLDTLKNYNRCLLAMDMGTGKTHTSSEKLRSLDFKHALVVCQKSLVSMWVKHLTDNYPEWTVVDYTKPKAKIPDSKCVIVLNYDIVFRRPELMALKNLSVILDECTIVSNPSARRTKAVFRLDIQNIIMLSGTISKGRYENLWTTLRLLGWNISKRDFYSRYIIEQEINIANTPYPVKIVVGYKNTDELKSMLRKYGSYFLKTEEVISLPEQTFVDISVPTTTKYRKFCKDLIVEVGHQTLVGSTTLNRMLYERMLCAQYNDEKLTAFTDLLESTDDRLIVFYNFNEELYALKKVIGNSRPISEVNGHTKDLTAYENEENSVTLCQYTSAAKGLNLQKANKIMYFSPTLSCEDWMQSQKRIHRIGQKNACFYYKLVCSKSIEERIYAALARGVDYTNKLFEEESQRVTKKIK
jgi:SNF2 family DNA or RNA helicase